jgi:hypothetical protein
MGSLAATLEAAAGDDVVARALVPVLGEPTGQTSAGHPYLAPRAWDWLRDRVPHLLGMGPHVLAAAERLLAVREQLSADEAAGLERAVAVLRQVVFTAAITAPPDLWLLRHVLSFFAELGLLQRLLAGEAIYPGACTVSFGAKAHTLHAVELDKDLQFLLARGLVEQYDDAYRIAGHPRVRALFAELLPLPAHWPASFTALFREAWSSAELDAEKQAMLSGLCQAVRARSDVTQTHWIPDRDELELGYRLVPVVLSLRAAEKTAALVEGAQITAQELCIAHPEVALGALDVLRCAGWLTTSSTTRSRFLDAHVVTPLGARGFARGPGPFGIIETYHPYMAHGRDILLYGPQKVWVARGENVGASQDANRATFEQANDALDAFCRDTGFRYGVFIEHAIGRGEATRQRFARSGDALAYVGADLEDASIDAAVEEQKRGRLPANMRFVRQADIGQPAVLIAALVEAGLEPRGAVMLVGNGFHEVRGQSDDSMVEVFRGYHEAGIVLLFTEESALSVDDLRATAWNTYHAGFRYVHDKSGQGLRPAEPSGRPTRVGRPLLAAWSECAQRAGYVRAARYCGRTRTIYPTTLRRGVNPAISVNHFVVPAPLAALLGL